MVVGLPPGQYLKWCFHAVFILCVMGIFAFRMEVDIYRVLSFRFRLLLSNKSIHDSDMPINDQLILGKMFNLDLRGMQQS